MLQTHLGRVGCSDGNQIVGVIRPRRREIMRSHGLPLRLETSQSTSGGREARRSWGNEGGNRATDAG
jgi:hypothetical protein